jgi:hypothetical protein
MFLTSRRIPPPFIMPVEASTKAQEALQPAPAGSPRTEAEQRLGEALLRIVLRANRPVETSASNIRTRAVPEGLISDASELLAELGY